MEKQQDAELDLMVQSELVERAKQNVLAMGIQPNVAKLESMLMTCANSMGAQLAALEGKVFVGVSLTTLFHRHVSKGSSGRRIASSKSG